MRRPVRFFLTGHTEGVGYVVCRAVVTSSERRVAVLFSERDRPENYVISKLAQYWREDGLRVEYLFGTRRHVLADVLIVHVDLSVLPESILDFAARYPRVINQHVQDIRKRTHSTLLVERRSGYAGPVIVKTDLNHAGAPERCSHPSRLTRYCHWARYGYHRLLTRTRSYRVYASLREVPAPVWSDRYLVVEKFLPERVGNDFAVRTYHCLGDRDSFFLLTSPHPVVRSGPATRSLPLPPDARLRELRRSLVLDYGKLDYVVVEGRPVIFDINKTIGLTPEFANDPAIDAARRERARGIYDFLR